MDVVTEADREVERLILGRIQDARPDDGVLGEEGASVAGSSGLTWVVDPIDGTVNYLYGIPHYAVSIAIVEGEPDPLTWTSKVGVVLNPATGELFSAEAGEGAFCGDRRIHVGEPVELDVALIATGFAYAASTRAFQGDVVARLLPRVRDILTAPTAWVFGNEAHGLTDEQLRLADRVVKVPIYGHAESLNLATAASVCLYESAFAQRS